MRKGVVGTVLGLTAAVWALPSWAVGVSGQGTWETTLQPRDLSGSPTTIEAYYDTVLDITWLVNANAAAGSIYDNGSNLTDGRMTFANAEAWAASLNYSGTWGFASDWRLPDTGPINGVNYGYTATQNGSTDRGYNISGPGSAHPGGTGSEMAHMFYNTLGNLGDCPVTGACPPTQAGAGLSNTGPFSNLAAWWYWSGRSYPPNTSSAWLFGFHDGYQGVNSKATFVIFAWAVHDGDVGRPVSPVPVPAAAWLLGSGLLGLVGVARRRSGGAARVAV